MVTFRQRFNKTLYFRRLRRLIFKRNDIPFNYVDRTLDYLPHIQKTVVNDLNVLTLYQDEYIEYQL